MNTPFSTFHPMPSTAKATTLPALAWLATFRRHAFALQLMSAVAAYALPLIASAEPPPHARGALPTVVLVHGAWADGSSWNHVIARLHARGLTVVSVQNQLNSLADDVAEVQRVIERQAAPVVLVGHSWGGTVVTQAGNADKVAALVYIAAFAPAPGESTNDVQRSHPLPGYVPLLQPDPAGYLWFPQDALPTWFAQDVSRREGRVLAATQNPIRASAFDDKVSQAAWQSRPSWYLVTDQDKMIYPDLQVTMARRIGARTTHVRSSHVPFLSKPEDTAAVILHAVNTVSGR